jgi:hypothetical protein
MYGKEWFHPADDSGLVIAGMGESEPFPTLLEYRVGKAALHADRHGAGWLFVRYSGSPVCTTRNHRHDHRRDSSATAR